MYMILKLVIVTTILLTLGFSGYAQQQTNTPPVKVVMKSKMLGSDLSKFGTDLVESFLTIQPFTTNGEAHLQFGGAINTQTKEPIEAVLLSIPTSTHTAVGFGGYHIGSDWADANANLQFGITNHIPFIGIVRTFVGDGAAWNFTRSEVANFSFTGQEKNWVIGSRFEAGVGYAICNTSDRAGIDILGGAHIGLKYGNGSGFLGMFGSQNRYKTYATRLDLD